ncbi:MAG: formimidoylglutamase [Wenzhouxiangella sp.]|nr:MAG: formimidoylglutamase [Wenzhouxiangella sp.]
MWEPGDPTIWQGRVDAEDGAAGLRWHQVIRPAGDGPPGTCLLGLASDRGVALNQGRVGAAEGPDALRRALANLAATGERPLYDAGNVRAGEDLPAAQADYARRAAEILDAGHFLIGLGGGHEIGWAGFQGVRAFLDRQGPNQRLGILNFDAHFDLRRPAPEATSGTPFFQAAEWCRQHALPFDYACIGISEAANTRALFATATELGVESLDDRNCTVPAAARLIRRLVRRVDALYITVCLDVLPASAAPGVSAPAALGIPPAFIIECLHETARACRASSCRWLLADIAELNPRFDPDGRTARTAARLVWEIEALQG